MKDTEVLEKPKVGTPLDKLTEEQEEQLGGHYYSLGYINESENSFRVGGMITGCGILQLHGLYQYMFKPELFSKHIEELKCEFSEAGFVIATVGPNNKRQHELLLKEGFRKMAEFNNWYDTDDDDGHIQGVYGLALHQDWREENEWKLGNDLS